MLAEAAELNLRKKNKKTVQDFILRKATQPVIKRCVVQELGRRTFSFAYFTCGDLSTS